MNHDPPTQAPSPAGAPRWRAATMSALAPAMALAPAAATAGPAALPGGGWLLAAAAAGALATAVAVALRGRGDATRHACLATGVQGRWPLDSLLEALPSPAFVKDGEGRYVAVNQAWLDLYGCRRDDVLGRTLTQTRHLHGEDYEALLQAEADLGAAGTVREIERGPARGHATPQVLSLRLRPLPARDGGHGGVVGTLVDTTELRAARLATESAARTTDTFLSMMGHEIRTPIAGALGIVELLAQTPLDQEQVHLLGMLEDSVDTLLHILGDILDFSRIEAGELKLEPVPCNLRALVDGVVALFAPQAADKGLRLYASTDWRLAAEYECDASRMRQVLANLLSNAIKFTDAGHVELRIEMLGGVEHGQRLRFSVSDTGPGMSAKQIERAMRSFLADMEPERLRTSGTGLGLALCRQLAQLMGGTLALSSRPDEGTVACFEVALPVRHGLAPQPDMAGRVALLCTRDARLGHGLANALSALGFNLIEAAPGDLGDIGADDAHLFLADAALVAEGRLPRGVRCIRIVDPATPAAAARPGAGVELQGVPLLWRATVKACHAALDLPPPDAAAETATTAMAPAARILVAEDHPINRAVISRQLQRLGYPHELVENGEQALVALAREHFDLLITDCRMPVLDGFALTSRIRASEQGGGNRLPIIALSASVLPGQVQGCTEAGMDGFLAKPVQLHDLEQLLATHLRRAATAQPPPSSPPAPAPPAAADGSSYRQLALLMEAFGSLRQVREVLLRLLETSRRDMENLDEALRRGDIKEQRDLLHRIGGSLRLLGEDGAAGPLVPGNSNRERRDALARRLESLEELLASLDPQGAAVDGG